MRLMKTLMFVCAIASAVIAAVMLSASLAVRVHAAETPASVQAASVQSKDIVVPDSDQAELYKLQLQVANAIIGRDMAAMKIVELNNNITTLQALIRERLEKVRKSLKCPGCEINWDTMRMTPAKTADTANKSSPIAEKKPTAAVAKPMSIEVNNPSSPY